MNCNVYFFIGTQKGYSQYPDNYSKDIISNILANTDRKKNLSQFAISMNGKLAYMTYQYRCSDSKYFGICCEYNNVVPTNFEYLFEFFDNIVQDILTKGEILHYDSTGIICPSIDYISDKIELVNYYSSYISNNLNDRLAKYVNLPSQNYASEKNKLVVLAYDDNHTQLIDLLNTYDNVVISRDNPYVLGYANTLKKSSEKISQLETELDKINRQKKQYKFVVTLFVIVILCCVGLFLFYKEITSKTEHIQELENEITIKNDSLRLQTNEINNLVNDLSSVKKELTDYKYKLGKHMPLIVTDIEMVNNYKGGTHETDFGGKIFSRNSMFLAPRVKCIGLVEGTRNLLVKLYRPDGSLSTGTTSSETPKGYSYSSSIYVYEGENTRELSSWGNKNKGNWAKGTYKIEVWYNDMCLKAKSFTIY